VYRVQSGTLVQGEILRKGNLRELGSGEVQPNGANFDRFMTETLQSFPLVPVACFYCEEKNHHLCSQDTTRVSSRSSNEQTSICNIHIILFQMGV
jgi:hypothetical protein